MGSEVGLAAVFSLVERSVNYPHNKYVNTSGKSGVSTAAHVDSIYAKKPTQTNTMTNGIGFQDSLIP